MPSWSTRLLPPSNRNEPVYSPADRLSPARSRGPSRVTESDILESAYGIPTLPTPNARTQSHGRSMSHPFPSLFSGKKKRAGEPAGYESTDDETVSPQMVRNTAYAPANKQKVPDKDLTTGKCKTCDSMVRWPKELKVFRCTVCLMINDLKPIALEARRGDGHREPVAVKPGAHRVPPLSLEKTKNLLDQCIKAYLMDRLNHGDEQAGSPIESPPLSPSWVHHDLDTRRGHAETRSAHDPNTQRLPHRTPPIHLSRRPVGASPRETVRRAVTTPYSTSSPGDFFASHMERQERATNSNRTNGGDVARPGNKYASGEKLEPEQQKRAAATKGLFQPLDDYILTSFGSVECINASFSTLRPNLAPRTVSEGNRRKASPVRDRHTRTDIPMSDELSDMDPKTLLLGDFAENGSWWTGGRSNARSPERPRMHRKGADTSADNSDSVTVKSSRIDWAEVNEWYHSVLSAGSSWRKTLDDLKAADGHGSNLNHLSNMELEDIEEQVMDAQSRTQRVLLKATESLLKRPGRPLIGPHDIRFLLIILANPLLYPSHGTSKVSHAASSFPETNNSRSRSQDRRGDLKSGSLEPPRPTIPSRSAGSPSARKGASGQHSGIIKRILGLLANVPNECHHYLVSWFARYSDGHFQRTVDLVGSFVTYRLGRQHGKRRDIEQDPTAGLIPSMSGSGTTSSAALHAALGVAGQPSKKIDNKSKAVVYNDDWQIKAAARVMALLFSANNSGLLKRGEGRSQLTLEAGKSAGLAARERAHNHGQIVPTSDFYNTLLDYSDLTADFEAWESKRGKFAFCQYPFFLSIWAKIKIMEHDARRQMEVKAREAFFDSIMTRKTVNQYLVLKVRRDCLVEDSLQGVSQVVGNGGEEIKKGLRIEFTGEEGIDAGGLRKEWFLLLVRDVFNPEHGMFTYDEDSRFCYFNPNSFETTDQFFLVGVVLGLAIYNSTILDVALPPFAFRKLLAAGPAAAPGATSHAKPSMTYSLEDLAEFRPALAAGLRQLLDFDGDVQEIYCRDFVADVDRYGQPVQVPLCPDGENRPVTNSNRREFVDLYVRYLLDGAVARQFEPFKRGFFTVCGGNALSLFRPEEIELLVRGSDEPLDISSLRAVSLCENWNVPNPAETEPVISWFWESFHNADPKDQRKLLSFITGSDRIPAMGATNLVIKLSCLGNDSPRFPVARTCFNMLSLWRYSSRRKLEDMLWRAVHESEGFGLK
ncbi:putative E3 ubiquitin-protein ligase [Lachnellula suecica]|uniref:HECT-type E3 ubiquitin transferase n=1 Tax=Lachnellula suecica TaxID=602035 RepID=A0A8T9CHD1_9HELO|nr:putative E3 ubiquitin-protein ligase [Lachnellula suecica]